MGYQVAEPYLIDFSKKNKKMGSATVAEPHPIGLVYRINGFSNLQYVLAEPHFMLFP